MIYFLSLMINLPVRDGSFDFLGGGGGLGFFFS